MPFRPHAAPSHRSPRHPAVRAPLLITALAAIVALAGCTGSPGIDRTDAAPGGDVSVDGRVVEIAAADRGDAVTFAGISEYGDPISNDEYADRVYVVNFWYAACGPCRVEAPLLEEVWQKYQPDDVGFVGVNIYDQPDTAIAFAKQYGITYPSVMDVNEGAVKLSFAAVTPIQATPTTLVMDRQGRVAARIIGQLPSASILSTLIADTLAETP